MKSAIIASALFLGTTVSANPLTASLDTVAARFGGNHPRDLFDAFISDFEKAYATEVEEKYRYGVFNSSLQRIIDNGNPAHGITKFSDLTPEEFKAKFLTFSGVTNHSALEAFDHSECPACKRFPEVLSLAGSGIDWTTKGAVTPVKNQGQCGSCWSFGTTGDIEGTHFLKHGKLVSLSEQMLVSCDKVDAGCNGGRQEDAFKFVMKKGGLVSEEHYRYTSGGGNTGKCNAKKEKGPYVASISGFTSVSNSKTGETKIASALEKAGPITIAINAGPMQDYTGGIDDPKNCASGAMDLDHAVLIVGYGEENGKKFWKIKNSWAKDWGEDGYYRIIRGVNRCGVAMDASHSKAK